VIRRHGVILDWGTGELFPQTTRQYRAMLRRRMVPHWAAAPAAV
jgi:N-methylhydantoinase B